MTLHNTPPFIGAVVAAVAAGAVATFQETVGAGADRRPVGEILQIIALVATVAGTLAGVIGGYVVQVMTLRIKAAVAPVAAAVAEVKIQTAEVKTQAEGIYSKVDGTASRMESALTASLAENKRLMELLGAQKQEQVAAVLAATQAQAPAAVPASVPEVIKDLASVHEQIETNTRETAKAVKHLEQGGPNKPL